MKTVQVNNEKYDTFLKKDILYLSKLYFSETIKEDYYEVEIMRPFSYADVSLTLVTY
jgi:hypothetical protein